MSQTDQNKYTGLEIAVVGMSCEFPGSENVGAFWDNLKAGNEGIAHLSKEELRKAGVTEDTIDHPSFVGVDGFLKNKEYFDNHFFNFTPHEAKVLDLQMRVFFQSAWHALEDAGINPDTYPGSIGLFAGARDNGIWQAYTSLTADRDKVDSFTLGQYNNKEFISTLLSYKLNLRGASIFMTTACSTSLVAIHQACRALLLGDADVSLAGGVSVSSTLTPGYFHQEGMIMSQDGSCRAFDEHSDGTVGGEGVGVVVLKRLKDAQKAGDNIYAIVKGSAVNNDGSRKVGYTAPSVDGQVDCIRKAHAMSRIDSSTIGYVEAHGTATKLGDPIEVQALNEVFGKTEGQKIALGSVKSNVGHTGVVAGVAGFIKTVLAIQNKQIPPSLHYVAPNPKVSFDKGPMYVCSELTDLTPKNGIKLRAGVSSFGIGGTNAHLVLEEAPLKVEQVQNDVDVFTFSGMNYSSVNGNKEAFIEFLNKNEEASLSDIANTLQKGRKHHAYRMAISARNRQEVIDKLTHKKPVAAQLKKHPIYFMCSGQGSQYLNMGKDLYLENAFFKKQMDEGLALMQTLTGTDFKAVLFGAEDETGSINRLEYSLPLLFLVEYAMAQLLIEVGVVPTKLIGHSSGEYAAACLSGVLSFEDGIQVILKRSELMQTAEEGRMLSVPLSAEAIAPMITEKLSLTAVNSSEQCVIGGKEEDIKTLKFKLEGLGYDCKEIKSTHAGHSYMMDSILEEFGAFLKGIQFNAPNIPIISNYTGKELSAIEAASPEYWCNHLRNTVQFADGLAELFKEENAVLIEIGPSRALCTFARQHKDKTDQLVFQTIRHPKFPENDHLFFNELLGQLWENGVDIDFSKLHAAPRQNVSLPGYAFDKIKYPVVADMKLISEHLGANLFAETDEDANALKVYSENWKQGSPVATLERATKTDWTVLFVDHKELQQTLKAKFESENQHVIVVEKGAESAQLSATHFTYAWKEEDSFKSLSDLMQNLEGKGRIVYTAHLVEPQSYIETASADQSLYFHDFTQLIKALDGVPFEENIQLDVITSGVHQVLGNEIVQPENALVYGAFKVLEQECFNVKMKTIDIDVNNNFSALMQELNCVGEAHEVCIRGAKRWMRGIELLQTTKMEINNGIKTNGFALITGCPGGMAQVMTEYYGTEHHMKIGLIGRSPMPEAWEQKLNELGIEFSFELADMSDATRMAEAIKALTDKYGSIIDLAVHTAGLGDYAGLLASRTRQDSADVLAPKVEGTHILMQELNKYDTEKVVFCSSRATEIAPIGQVAYIAGNEYQNAVAKTVSKAQLISIGWEAWKEIGMAIKSQANKGEKTDGHLETALTNAEAMELMNRSLTLGLPHVVVSRKNLELVKAEYRKQLQKNTEKAEDVVLTNASRNALNSELIAPENEVEQQLLDLWRDFFGIENIGVEDDFFELGGDSLKLMRMHRTICSEMNIQFELVELFIHFKIRPLANFLVQAGLVSLGEELNMNTVETIEF